MKISAIICEYNPFHNGHKFQIDSIKKSGATHIIAIMSGHLMQRGDISCISKWERTKMALKNGIDLVIELPSIFSNSSAENFAKCAIHILDKLKIVDELSFGSECGDIKKLNYFCKIYKELEKSDIIKQFLKKGLSYPKAINEAINFKYGNEFSNLISQPNNVLAIEYIKAIKSLNSSINVSTIKRKNVDHDSDIIVQDFASASKIRKIIYENPNNVINFVPDNIKNFYYSNNNFSNIKNLEQIIIYKLRTSSINDFKLLPDVNEGLENRLFKYSHLANSYDEFLYLVKTKRYTLAKIRRIIFSLLVGIKKSDILFPKYIRILGTTKNGLDIIKKLKNYCCIPIFTSFKKLNDSFYQESIFEKIATDLFLISSNNLHLKNIEYTHPFIIL